MSAMRIFAIAQRIARQFSHDKRTLGLLFVVPIVIISLLGPLLTAKPVYNIGIVNGDLAYSPPARAMNLKNMTRAQPSEAAPQAFRSFIKPTKVSERIVQALKKDSDVRISTVKSKDVDELLKKGKLVTAVTFPADFSKKLMTGGKPDLKLVVDGSNPSVAQGAIGKIQKTVAGLSNGTQPMLETDFKYGGNDFGTLDYFAPAFVAFFAFFFVFLLTSVSFLRERGQGTIERLMASPASRLEVILGYQLGFILFATAQVTIILLYTIYALKVHYVGNIGAIFLVEFLLTLVAVNMGIFFSSFATNELQVVQFIPIVIVPQGLISGFIIPVDELPKYFQWLAQILPLTHANYALKAIMLKGYSLADVAFDLAFLVAFALLMVALSAITIRRRVA